MTKESGDTSKKEVSTSSTPQFQCPMLKPSNYSLWAIRMQIILEANGLWEMIEPLETTQADNKKHKTAIAFLYQALPEDQLLQITKHKTAKAIWNALKTRHIGKGRIQQERLQTLKSNFEMLHMKKDETIDTFTGKTTTLVNKAASLRHTIEDRTLVRKLLNAVPDRYLQIVASIEQYFDLSEMTMEEAIGRLKTYEERIKYKKEPTLLMAILEDTDEGNQVKEVKQQKVSLHEEDVGYKETNIDSQWYLDNGASNHMTGVREHFKEIDEKVSGKVRFRDGGSILIECDDEKQRIISHVYYIHWLKSNLLSLGQFTKIGCKVVMEDDELRLYDMDNKLFMKVTRQRNRLYKSSLRIGTPVCLLANLKDDTWLWHARLGHLNFESLRSMAQRNLVLGIPAIKHTTQICDVCLIGKHSRAPFPKKAKARSSSPLDLVYGDLCGPITPPTPSGKKYIFLLVDDYSRYIWVYFLSTIDQAFDTFKEYKKTIEKELRMTLKMLRTDLTIDDDAFDLGGSHDNKFADKVLVGSEDIELRIRLRAIGDIIQLHFLDIICLQEHGIDFEEVFAPVVMMETIRLLLAIAANNKWEVHHLDVKSAFLHGDLKEKVHLTQTEGFIKRQDNEKVYRLIKALYGLRQAPRAWNIKLDDTLKSLYFNKYALEQAIYTKISRDSTIIVGVYVDDLIITGTPKKEINKFKAQMEEKFKMSDLGLLAYYLGIEVTQIGGDISIKQSANAIKILKEAGMIDCDETLIPMDPGTRLTKITEGTMAIRQVLRYVKETKDYGITYKHNGGDNIHGFSDSSYGVNTQKGKRITGIIFYYGESPISWSTQKQATVALASCEYEFIAATAVATQALWLKRQLSELTHSEEEKITIMVDNKSAIALMKNPIFHERSKHIDTKYHFIRECVEREDIQVEFVSGEYQKADILIGLRDLRQSDCD
nr:ribonuclease H-like domain, reverse transcriptase, RNA-dependent DNA polymerase [Tanacetum cinerariifolium]